MGFCWMCYVNSVGMYAFFAYYTVVLGFGLFDYRYDVVISGFGFWFRLEVGLVGFSCAGGVGMLCIDGLFWFDYDDLWRDSLVSGCFVFVWVCVFVLVIIGVLRALLVVVFVVVYIWLCLLFAFWAMGFVSLLGVFVADLRLGGFGLIL